MRYHFIAIGGSAMHNLAIALHKKGETVSGSDDEIFDPAKSNLERYGLLPSDIGWHKNKITRQLDAIVLGMHAKADNPELLEAQRLGLKIYSYPEFLYEQTKHKKRIVIGGSHGKTTTTAMIMHVLKEQGIKFDYMVGAKIDGFDTMVNLQNESEYAVFEGDEYLTSPIDPRPKFHLYKPHIGLITGVAWDHINVFPTFKFYKEQFQLFIDQIQDQGTLAYFEEDPHLPKMVEKAKPSLTCHAYNAPTYEVIDGDTIVKCDNVGYKLSIFGKHNMQNLGGALAVCRSIGMNTHDFYKAISSFKGAHKRLQLLAQNSHSKAFLDFAHSPSKLEATINAVKDQFPSKKIIAVMELHTYSSLNKDFLSQYKNTMKKADVAMVYYSQHALEIKKLPPINEHEIMEGFDKEGLMVYKDQKELKNAINFMELNNSILLLLSSGNFSGIDLQVWTKQLLQ